MVRRLNDRSREFSQSRSCCASSDPYSWSSIAAANSAMLPEVVAASWLRYVWFMARG